tara:strand:+ start:2800 stop:2928 length:129 start_codon:yes stop_codon:yes gene_type:complete
MSIEQAFEEYLSIKKIEGVRQKTIDLNQLALSSLYAPLKIPN